jgi:hypothetical protein
MHGGKADVAGSLAGELLDAWESTRARAPAEQSNILTGLTAPDRSTTELDEMGLGDRQRRLLALRRSLFGTRIEGIADCMRCERLFEVGFPIEPLLEAEPGDATREHEERFGGFDVTFRLPTVADAQAAGHGQNADEAHRLLLDRCVLRASQNGESIEVGDLPSRICQQLGERIGELDPLSDIELTGTCPECGARWVVAVDIGRFLWAELDGWARRTLSEIDALARVYGWTEREILALGPTRRRLYVELARC